jgi:hypothetical protein
VLVGHGGGGDCRAVRTGERGGVSGLRVENVGRPGEKGNGSGPENSGIFDLFKKIQTCSNCFDQKLDLPSSKKFK